jgi:hypothetical protein
VHYARQVPRDWATIDAMTTTPDDQDWLRLAEEALTCPQNAEGQDTSEQQPPWRYRAPAF